MTRIGLANRIRSHPGLTQASGSETFRAAVLLADTGDLSDLPHASALAQIAHGEGIAGAGTLYAHCSDKLALYGGRPQPYGTFTIEYQGDIIQPPVDPATTDDERGALGVLPLLLLRQKAEEATRELARARASQPGELPPGQQSCRVWSDQDPAELRARMKAEGAKAWADGDVITFVTESESPVAVTPVFPVASWEAGDGLQVLSMRVNRLDEAVITYTFTPLGGTAAMNFSRGSHDGRFRGPLAPDEMPSNNPLVGSTSDHGIESVALGHTRHVTVYRPPGHQVGEDIPVVYATDGNMLAPYARRLDAAMDAGVCPRVVIVAAHAAPPSPTGGDQRTLEYLAGFDDDCFDAHRQFFVDELASWAEAELGLADDREKRGIFGCSDGGGHALTTGLRYRDRFGHVFAYSTGTPPEPSMPLNDQTYPFVHLCAGTLEGPFHQATVAWAGYLHHLDTPYHFTERVAGHDLIQWCEELPRALARAWD